MGCNKIDKKQKFKAVKIVESPNKEMGRFYTKPWWSVVFIFGCADPET